MKTHEGLVIHELNNKNIFEITYVSILTYISYFKNIFIITYVSKYNKLYHAY